MLNFLKTFGFLEFKSSFFDRMRNTHTVLEAPSQIIISNMKSITLLHLHQESYPIALILGNNCICYYIVCGI